MSTTTAIPGLRISAGHDEQAIQSALPALVSRPSNPWQITSDKQGLERTFNFKTFNKTWAFMDKVAAECKSQRHHPEWANVYNHTHIRWTTHNPEGLSSKDVHMATFCDEVGREFDEVVVERASGGGDGDGDGHGAVDRVRGVAARLEGAAECCKR